MPNSANVSVRWNIGAYIVVLAIIVGGTWGVVQVATDRLLYLDSTTAARSWARYLAESVSDLEQIAAGEQPSSASMTFFKTARRSGEVFRYVIYNRQGYSQLVSDHETIALVDLSEFSDDAARSLSESRPIVDVREGGAPGMPAYFAQAYVPVIVGGRAVAVVAAYVDQTEHRAGFYSIAIGAAAALCALTGLSFSIPTLAWFFRTKEKQVADRRIRFLAHHDALTGLINRARLIDRLSAAITHGGVAVHFLDLDRFKEANDTLGHDGGDFLLKTIADRLRAASRADDVVARLGGDEFVVVQANVRNTDEAAAFAHRLLSAVMEPIWFKEQEINATMSVGVALAPADGETPERLLRSADLALYKSKADGRNCVRFFLPEMDQELQARIELERTIRDAVCTGAFALHYQPLFCVADRQVSGFEALVRLPRPDGTLIPPMVFIPVAEEMRLIDKITHWVLREACRTALTWPQHLTIAVNLSTTQFESGGVVEMVAATLRETGLDPHRLELEITESLLLGDNAHTMGQLRELKAMGVAIVMDDFGTGYSSLGYLWRFPFDKIKIDRSFMEGFNEPGRDAETVVKTIIALGRELHMRVTVEGVETEKQADFLTAVDSDQAQGYFFGRPVPASEIAAGILTNFKNRIALPPPANDDKIPCVG